jgi:mannose-6-phosphate isomerase-like protein (cupin superfamily)
VVKTTSPLLVGPGDGHTVCAWGVTTTFKTRAEQTAGAWSLVEQSTPAGYRGAPSHRHVFDEVYYVLDGCLAFRLADERVVAPSGTLVMIPSGTPHTFANPHGTPARFLVFMVPGGFERFLEQMSDLARTSPRSAPMNELLALLTQHGTALDE